VRSKIHDILKGILYSTESCWRLKRCTVQLLVNIDGYLYYHLKWSVFAFISILLCYWAKCPI